MKYELAKKLEDAGFLKYEEDWVDEVGFVLVHPTLSELIEECGDNFRSIIKAKDFDPPYQANAYNGFGNNDFAYGQSPEEAVANLWLKLNKKS